MASRLKRSNRPKWNFFLKNNKIFMYLLAPFILQNFKRILRVDPELSGCAIFGHKIAHLSWTIFFRANHYYYFHLPVGPFHCAKFTKNSYSRSKVVRMLHFWTQNDPFSPNNFLQRDEKMDGGQTHCIFRTIPAGDRCPKNPQSKIGILVSITGHVHLIIAVLGLWHPNLQLHETSLEKMKTE